MTVLLILVSLAVGVYLGIGFCCGCWYYLDDLYDDGLVDRVGAAFLLMLFWFWVLVFVVVEEELR